MRVAISSKGKNIDDTIDMRFGRCEYFQIHDTENKQVQIIENKGKSAEGGAGIAAAQQILDEKVDVVITGSLGPNAFLIINKAGIKAYGGGDGSIASILKRFKDGNLSELTEAGKSHQGLNKG